MLRNQDQNLNLKKIQSFYQAGFTVVELMVVFLIIVLLSSSVIVNWNKQTPNRSLKIAENELVSNIKKVQSYAVSSRNIAGGNEPAKFYLIRLEEGTSYYTIHALDQNYNLTSALESISLPGGVTFTDLSLVSTTGGGKEGPVCTYIIFSVTYGKVYFDHGGNPCGSTLGTLVQSLPSLAPRSNFNLEINFTHTQSGVNRTVEVVGLNGKASLKADISNGPVGK